MNQSNEAEFQFEPDTADAVQLLLGPSASQSGTGATNANQAAWADRLQYSNIGAHEFREIVVPPLATKPLSSWDLHRDYAPLLEVPVQSLLDSGSMSLSTNHIDTPKQSFDDYGSSLCMQGNLTAIPLEAKLDTLLSPCSSNVPAFQDSSQGNPTFDLPNDFHSTGLHAGGESTGEQTHSNLDPCAGFQFQSGAVVLEDRSSASLRSRPPKNETGLKCKWPGCNYRGSFARKYELQRHRSKHTDKTQYRCPIVTCEASYYRVDKLSHHLYRVHSEHDEAECPIAECKASRLPWLLLRLHAQSHYSWHNAKGPNRIVRAIRAVETGRRYCPIAACQNPQVSNAQMQAHLQGHRLQERKDHSQAMLEAGFDAISTRVICPVCKSMLPTVQDLQYHVEDTHIVTDGERVRVIRNELERRDVYWCYGGFAAWRPEPLDSRIPESELPRSTCDGDSFERIDRDYHIQFLRDPEPLRPHRLAILKLWPEFANHPVFDDIVDTA